MVLYFKARPHAGDYTIYMGADKYENEELIKYGLPEDVWYVAAARRSPSFHPGLLWFLRPALSHGDPWFRGACSAWSRWNSVSRT
jgi:hypothetical protein